MKIDKHERILQKKNEEKRKHLDRLATKLLQEDEKAEKMKGYKLKNNPLDLF